MTGFPPVEETALQTTKTTINLDSQLPQVHEPRNAVMPLDLDWVASVQANTSAIERRAASLPGRRSVKKDYQAAWLCKSISLMDLTTLSGDDSEGRVRRLCAKARQPVSQDILEKLGMQGLTTGAVCVYHDMVETAVDALRGTNIPVAAVSTGFPAGLSPFHLRLQEIRESVAAGAKEIDIVISRRHALTGNWQALYDEMVEMREACGDAHVKAILATGELGTLRNVARASLVCMMAGADFIKTSTGKEPVNELGDRWLQPDLFRFGASSLLGDIERQLEHHVTGAYSAQWRHAIG